jgi:hypothetical protein
VAAGAAKEFRGPSSGNPPPQFSHCMSKMPPSFRGRAGESLPPALSRRGASASARSGLKYGPEPGQKGVGQTADVGPFVG